MAKNTTEPIVDLEKAAEYGYLGVKVDPEPNEVYTIAGVTGVEQHAPNTPLKAKPEVVKEADPEPPVKHTRATAHKS